MYNNSGGSRSPMKSQEDKTDSFSKNNFLKLDAALVKVWKVITTTVFKN